MGRKPPATSVNLLRGTLDLLILRTLALQEMHGLGISDRIEQVSNGTFQVKPGSLFPALHRMEEAGRKKLEAETEQWNRISLGVASILNVV